MKKLLSNLKYIKMYDILSIFIFLIIVFPALVFRLFAKITKRHIWLISEDGQVARDNGYYFFKYMRTNHKNARAYFVINKKAHDYEKVKEYGNIIRFRSLKHWFYYIGAEYNISNQKNGNPAQALFYVLHVKLNFLNNRVFLQHGITKDESDWILYKNTKFRYFVCAAKREFEYIKNNFGYPEDNVILTGFPRYDTLVDESAGKKQILIMPTWRNWLGRETNKLVKDENFEESDYFKNWNGLINDEEFIGFIESNDIKVKFYPHVNMERFIKSFHSPSKNIEIMTSDTDIQQVMRQSSLMITDFSSVAMDFAYMEKPVVYYQFDQKEYREKQLKKGYYDYRDDGFGPIALSVSGVVGEMKKAFKRNKFEAENKYLERVEEFFGPKKNNRGCCDRLYSVIKDEKLKRADNLALIDIIMPIIFFCIVFMFKIYGPIDSCTLAATILTVVTLFSKKLRAHAINLLKTHNHRPFIIATALTFGWAMTALLLNQTNDYGVMKIIGKTAAVLLSGFLSYSLADCHNRSERIVNYILVAFLIQSILQIVFFMLPDFSRVFDYLRGEESILAAKHYVGFRGLAITKTPYFTLSVSYGIAFMLFFSKYNTISNNKIIKIILLFILLFGNIFAGRVGFVGLVFVPFMVNWKTVKFKKPTKKGIFITLVAVIGMIGAVFAAASTPQGQKLSKYVFEITNNITSGKGIETRSTNKLLKMFDRSFREKTLLIGDGKFQDGKGYYMSTDVGYYRKVYYGGVLFVVLLLLWHFTLAGRSARTKEIIIITIFLAIMELKGVTVGLNAMVYAVVYPLILLANSYKYKNIKVSVVLPTLNTDKEYLAQSINSILNQTHRNIELLIVVDGGNDDNFIRNRFNDERITIIKHDKTMGIAKSLNEAITKATGKYILRMDADDISNVRRAEFQVEFMENHNEIAVASSFYRKFGRNNIIATEPFIKPHEIYAKMFYTNPILHPAIIMRASAIREGHYLFNPVYERAEDYELWQRISSSGGKIAIIKEFCLKYRNHPGQISVAKRQEQIRVAERIHVETLKRLHLGIENTKYLFMLSGQEKISDKKALKGFVETAIRNNRIYGTYENGAFRKILRSGYDVACMKNKILVFPSRYTVLLCFKKLAYKIRYLFAAK